MYFDCPAGMNFLGSEYYKLNRRLLLLIGLWPYEHSVFKYCQTVLCNIVVGLITFCQIAKLITLRRNLKLVMTLLSPIVICTIYIIKYLTFCIVAKKLRYLMEHVEKDWNMLKDKKELEIMERYAYIGSFITLGLTIFNILCTLTCSFVPFIPNVLDILMPLNVSRPRHLLFPGEYFVDQEKYFYAIVLFLAISMCVIFTTFVGTESLYIMYVQHACGMFQVSSYRMDQAFDNKFSQDYASEKHIIIYKKIIEAIYYHKRALEFFEVLWSTLAVSYSILLMIGVTSLLINLFCLFQAALLMKETNDIVILALFAFIHVIYLFFGNYIAQVLIDHSSDIFENIYITQWHGAPLQVQRLLPMIMQRSMKSCKMAVGGGMFVPSLEGFAAIMSTTISYFTVLWSVQN